jgi:beta-phosphoglucomutase-like phosphatase (HAD superfamily)
VIEDSQNGLEAAKAAGMNCIVTISSYTGGEDFNQADRVVADLDAGIDLAECQALVQRRA